MLTIDPTIPVAPSSSPAASAWRIIRFAVAWLSRRAVIRFCSRRSSTEVSSGSSGSDSITCREALTRMSMRSKASTVSDKRLVIVSRCRRSPAKSRAGPSSPAIWPASAWSASSSMSARTTRAPCSTKCRAMARPTPCAAPVTMAVLPWIEKAMLSPSAVSVSAGRHGRDERTDRRRCRSPAGIARSAPPHSPDGGSRPSRAVRRAPASVPPQR